MGIGSGRRVRLRLTAGAGTGAVVAAVVLSALGGSGRGDGPGESRAGLAVLGRMAGPRSALAAPAPIPATSPVRERPRLRLSEQGQRDLALLAFWSERGLDALRMREAARAAAAERDRPGAGAD
jgi:hypothetical protein